MQQKFDVKIYRETLTLKKCMTNNALPHILCAK